MSYIGKGWRVGFPAGPGSVAHYLTQGGRFLCGRVAAQGNMLPNTTQRRCKRCATTLDAQRTVAAEEEGR